MYFILKQRIQLQKCYHCRYLMPVELSYPEVHRVENIRFYLIKLNDIPLNAPWPVTYIHHTRSATMYAISWI